MESHRGVNARFHSGFPLPGGRTNSMATGLKVPDDVKNIKSLEPYKVVLMSLISRTLFTYGRRMSW